LDLQCPILARVQVLPEEAEEGEKELAINEVCISYLAFAITMIRLQDVTIGVLDLFAVPCAH
jgi:hypothetical protein